VRFAAEQYEKEFCVWSNRVYLDRHPHIRDYDDRCACGYRGRQVHQIWLNQEHCHEECYGIFEELCQLHSAIDADGVLLR